MTRPSTTLAVSLPSPACTSMATTFTFIDHAHLDRKARRTIRGHVMRGKNVGKVRVPKVSPSQARKDKVAQNPGSFTDTYRKRHAYPPDTTSQNLGVQDQLEIYSRPYAWIRNEFSSLSSPFEITAQSRRSIYNFLCYVGDAVYPAEFCKDRPDPSLTIWFQYMIIDEAFFHCFVALSEACMDFVTGQRSQSFEHYHHIASALRLINNKLSSSEAVTDTNLASIVYLCLLSSIREQPLQTKLHFDGLCSMIEARGGVKTLISTPGLLEKTRRLDIDIALQLGCKTKLGRSTRTLNALMPSVTHLGLEIESPLINAIHHADPMILVAAQEVIRLADLINSSSSAEKLSACAFQDTITTTCYRLLDISSLDNSTDDLCPISAAVYLGLLSFMTTFLIQIGRQRYLRYELLSSRLKEALNNTIFRDAIDPATHLWLLVIAGISVLDENDFIWLESRLTEVSQILDRTDWEFTRRLLVKYPWIDNLHDKPALRLWGTRF